MSERSILLQEVKLRDRQFDAELHLMQPTLNTGKEPKDIMHNLLKFPPQRDDNMMQSTKITPSPLVKGMGTECTFERLCSAL